jgi:NDP-sugar pyrophosphorylase family protein
MEAQRLPREIDLVLPAAGLGSRFSQLGFDQPKPLLNLAGKPFFWWAVESVRRSVTVRQLVFVVLEAHVRDFEIDRRIRAYYPQATIVPIAGVTSGAAESAAIGVKALTGRGPLAVNDCDHAFICQGLPAMLDLLHTHFAGALMCFRSASPSYSYARVDEQGRVTGTVEKVVASPFAIAGCYLFSGAERFLDLYEGYREACGYSELFMSGLYNRAAQRQLPIGLLEVDRHWSFGTPEELQRLNLETLGPLMAWK